MSTNKIAGTAQAAFARSMRPTRLLNLKCTATNLKGETADTTVTIAYNKLSELSGNGLSSYDLYILKKTGVVESTDIYGNKFIYQILAEKREGADFDLKTDTPDLNSNSEDLKTKDAAIETGEPNEK